jgi:hypothetical protein
MEPEQILQAQIASQLNNSNNSHSVDMGKSSFMHYAAATMEIPKDLQNRFWAFLNKDSTTANLPPNLVQAVELISGASFISEVQKKTSEDLSIEDVTAFHNLQVAVITRLSKSRNGFLVKKMSENNTTFTTTTEKHEKKFI